MLIWNRMTGRGGGNITILIRNRMTESGGDDINKEQNDREWW